MDDYKRDYGNLSDDLDRLIARVYEDMEEIKVRFSEKATEITEHNLLREEYETCIEDIARISLAIESKSQKPTSKLNLESLKVKINFWKGRNDSYGLF